jgi:hypothetical protein
MLLSGPIPVDVDVLHGGLSKPEVSQALKRAAKKMVKENRVVIVKNIGDDKQETDQ